MTKSRTSNVSSPLPARNRVRPPNVAIVGLPARDSHKSMPSSPLPVLTVMAPAKVLLPVW